jgi:hypothetical protein
MRVYKELTTYYYGERMDEVVFIKKDVLEKILQELRELRQMLSGSEQKERASQDSRCD